MDCAQWPYEEATERLELTLLGNIADLDKRPEYVSRYYDGFANRSSTAASTRL